MDDYNKGSKDVALVLASGGPRGFAYIGAIEELESRGYNITSIAGTSAGSLVGGIYAAGKLDDVKDWLFSLDAWNVFSLMDFSISKNHLVKGEKVIEAILKIVPEVNIEDLKIPFRAVATDLYTGEEVVFDRGPLFQAIRASISIPSLFRPVKYGLRTLIDGGVTNTLPLSRVVRHPGDILVAFDVNDIDVDAVRQMLVDVEDEKARFAEIEQRKRELKRSVLDSLKYNDNLTLREKIQLAGGHGYRMIKEMFVDDEEEKSNPTLDAGNSYYGILSRSFSLMNHVMAQMSCQIYKPDILAEMPFDAYDDISDYAKAREIAERGRQLMKNAIDEFESRKA